MKRLFLACAAMALLGGCTPKRVTPTPVQQAAQAFGLMGSWADTCNPPPATLSSGMVLAAEPDGSVSLTFNDGHGTVTGRYSLKQGRIIAPDQIAFDGADTSGVDHIVLQKNPAGQLRVFENVDGTGQVYVKDGAFPAGGGPNWENRCA